MDAVDILLDKAGYNSKTLLPVGLPDWVIELYEYGKEDLPTEGWIGATGSIRRDNDTLRGIAFSPGNEHVQTGHDKVHAFLRVVDNAIVEMYCFYCPSRYSHADFNRPYRGEFPLSRTAYAFPE